MKTGALRSRVSLKKPLQTANSFNETVVSYSTVDTVWAAIEWGSGRRFLEAAKYNSEVQGVIRVRYRTDIKPFWRISYGDRTFEVLSTVNVREKRSEMLLNCKEVIS